MTTPLKIPSQSITQKNKSKSKTRLWALFDNEILHKTGKNIECVYRKEGTREACDCCKSVLYISDEGFLTCQNKTCGIIYKDSLDNSAEWRYYGADDNQNGDPTRCGMPINPLLKESSFGCTVICPNQSSYEMRKIRRYTEWQSMPYKEKSQYDEFQKITIIAHNAGLPKLLIDEINTYNAKYGPNCGYNCASLFALKQIITGVKGRRIGIFFRERGVGNSPINSKLRIVPQYTSLGRLIIHTCTIVKENGFILQSSKPMGKPRRNP